MSDKPVSTSRNDQPCASCEVPREILERIRPAVLRYALEGEQALLKCKRGGLPAHYEDTLQRDALARDALLCAVDDILSITKRRVVSESGHEPNPHSFAPTETDTKLLHAWTGVAYLYPPLWNLTMLRMAGDVVLTVRLPAPEPRTMGAFSSVRFTREMWREFARQLPEFMKVYDAADYLDGEM